MTEEQRQSYQTLPPDPYSPLFNQPYYDDRVGLARELDPLKDLIETVNSLRGQLKDPKTGKVAIKFNRMLNEEGVSVFINAVRAGANSINTNSNYRADDKLIYALMRKWIADLIYIFYYDRKKFAIHINDEGEEEKCLISDEANVSVIINLATGLLLPSFFKALGAGDRGAITRSVQEMISKHTRDEGENQQPQRRGIISRMNPFSR